MGSNSSEMNGKTILRHQHVMGQKWKDSQTSIRHKLGGGGYAVVRDCSDGNIYRRLWDDANCNMHIDEAMRHCKWLQIKCCMKLNSNETVPEQRDEKYDPTYNFDFI
eukprot:5117614-Ditylum_brightwellii.AAC.1